MYLYTLEGDTSTVCPPPKTKVPTVNFGCQQKLVEWRGDVLNEKTIPRSPKLSGVQLLKGSLGPIRKTPCHFTSTKTSKTFRPYLWLSNMNEGISHLAAYGHPSHWIWKLYLLQRYHQHHAIKNRATWQHNINHDLVTYNIIQSQSHHFALDVHVYIIYIYISTLASLTCFTKRLNERPPPRQKKKIWCFRLNRFGWIGIQVLDISNGNDYKVECRDLVSANHLSNVQHNPWLRFHY